MLNLSEEEIQILIRLSRRNKAIAEELGLKLRTVEKHIECLLAKLKVPTREAALLKAIQLGFEVFPPLALDDEPRTQMQNTVGEGHPAKMRAGAGTDLDDQSRSRPTFTFEDVVNRLCEGICSVYEEHELDGKQIERVRAEGIKRSKEHLETLASDPKQLFPEYPGDADPRLASQHARLITDAREKIASAELFYEQSLSAATKLAFEHALKPQIEFPSGVETRSYKIWFATEIATGPALEEARLANDVDEIIKQTGRVRDAINKLGREAEDMHGMLRAIANERIRYAQMESRLNAFLNRCVSSNGARTARRRLETIGHCLKKFDEYEDIYTEDLRRLNDAAERLRTLLETDSQFIECQVTMDDVGA